MRKLNLYNFHKGIPTHRFDHHNTNTLVELLSDEYDVHVHNYNGQDKFHYENVLIDQGSILIFEFDDTKEFKTFDFGDAPTLTVRLSRSKNFVGAAIGQYNKKLWDDQNLPEHIRQQIVPSVYPESCWNFGSVNYETVQEFRTQTTLDKRLHWRGSIYKDHGRPEYYDVRRGLELLSTKLKPFHFGNHPIPYDTYIQEALLFKIALGYGGGGGYSCGDFCLRDIEMFGLGIPLLRPKYVVETYDPLIPNIHYISVDCEFDETFRYKNPELLSDAIAERYHEVVDNEEFLQYIIRNAHDWYLKNVSGPNISRLIKTTLQL
jgi:hypothetical protein